MTKEYWPLEEAGHIKMGSVDEVVDVVLRICVDENIIGKTSVIPALVNPES
jgi:hypothetical protein